MRLSICIVGGIFDKSPSYRLAHAHTPETLLADGLAELGHRVERRGHKEFTTEEGYDVVHVHHAGRAAYLMAAASGRARFVFTGHDGSLLCGYEQSKVRGWAFRQVLLHCDTAVSLSAAEEDFIQRLGSRRIKRIPNGIPTFYGTHAPVPAAPRRGVLYVGQLIPLKGVDVLLRALARGEVPPGTGLTLVYQNDTLEQPLRALAAELGIADRVTFVGPLPPERLQEIYRGAEVFVLPSRAESLPSVVSEALLAGTPVVATRVGGIPEQVGDFGELVDPGDVAGLAAALGRALRSPPSPGRTDAARERAKEFTSIDRMVRAHDDLYRSLLEEGPRPRRHRLARAACRAVLRLYPRR